MILGTAWLATPAAAQLDAAAAASARAGTGESPPVRPDFSGALSGLSLAGQAVMIPVVGRIGTDVVAEGFELLAEQRGALAHSSAIVIDLDSDSGSDAEALRIAAALAQLRESAPVVILVRRAIGPAALLLPVANRVLIPEPAPSGTIIAVQPGSNPQSGASPAEAVEQFLRTLAPIVESSPRRTAWQSLISDPSRWQQTARSAYGQGIADPLDGGLPALGRALRIDPWVLSGRQVEDAVRRSGLYAQQLQMFRAKLTARAFASLAQANETIGQIALAEQTAASLDPRRPGVAPTPRYESARGGWALTASSALAWNKACEHAAGQWQRVAALCDDAERQLRAVTNDIGALVSSAALAPMDPLLPDAIDRLERERADLHARVDRLHARRDAALAESQAILALRRS